MQEYPQKLTNLKVAERKPLETMPHLQDAVRRCNAELGSDGRSLVRYSGTENLLRIMVEARTSQMVEQWTKELTRTAQEDMGI